MVGTDDEPSRSDDDAVGGRSPLERRTLFRVVRGAPEDHETAALTAVLAAATSAGGEDEPAPATPDLWSHPAAQLRAPLMAGPGAWRASGLPR
ncbi:acyl-CoA carboxylase subunit epsilon [Pseudonocardia nantongensis]|uniref:acyl-CoA carboxylase subunit epsilon n=1 Tax=Pseudonocardia nantongensis TaxID=1181885 RepID=UPI00397857CA